MLHEKELTSKGKVRALYKVSWYSWTMCFTIPKASALAPKKICQINGVKVETNSVTKN